MSNQEKKSKYGCYKCGKEQYMTDAWGHNLCVTCYIKTLGTTTKKRRK